MCPCRQRQTGHYLGKGEFINRERFLSSQQPLLTEPKSSLHLRSRLKVRQLQADGMRIALRVQCVEGSVYKFVRVCVQMLLCV